MDNRREFLKKAALLSGSAGLMGILPPAIQKALAINPAPGSTFMDAEHVVFLMQENRSFDHAYGTLRGVRGFNDPHTIQLPNGNPVWLQTDKTGQTFAPFRLNIKDTKATWMNSLPHSWTNQVDARNGGKYDRWLDVKHSGNKEYAPMPLTLGYYTREDIPFYYSLADAFTVCDQHFCSSLTGTTPNRLYFWSGTIRPEQTAVAPAMVWNGDADYPKMVSWTTFPERLEASNVSWKVYQNEISVGVGFEGEEDAWLANFTDNPLEFFTQYNVNLAPKHIAFLQTQTASLQASITKLQSGAQNEEATKKITALQEEITQIEAAKKLYTNEAYEALTPAQKQLHEKAFTTNKNDPDYHNLTSLQYDDAGTKREMKVPKGDVLHQFREDVQKGALPTVSWLVAPENFSDHPGAPWYGAWYLSEVMDILTKNPEVWKKTIFILTYDENDGYFDHVPPYVAPQPARRDTGHASIGIDTNFEFVKSFQQSSEATDLRESPIGLGYRVPMVVASPWSRGGWVNSQVFDHTSSLQFLEKFLEHKTGKPLKETNITDWRRTVCGDLTSIFRPYQGEKISKPTFVQKDAFIESIHKAQFKNVPTDYKVLLASEISAIKAAPVASHPLMPKQEKGVRNSCVIPYELYADGQFYADTKQFGIQLRSGNEVFGEHTAGAPFHIYAHGLTQKVPMQARSYAVKVADMLEDTWKCDEFKNGQYLLRVYGPNGFFREFTGNTENPALAITGTYERSTKGANKLSGNFLLRIKNTSANPQVINVTDVTYKSGKRSTQLAAGASTELVWDLSKTAGWYDLQVTIDGNKAFAQRYAGRVENGQPGTSDPAMGQMI